MTRWWLLLAVVCAGCGDPDYGLEIAQPMDGATITTDEVDMGVNGTKLGDGNTLAATLDGADIPSSTAASRAAVASATSRPALTSPPR